MVSTGGQQSESRDRVLNAAYRLFLQNGLTAVSMQQIAAEVGITKATLYHHFRDKEALFLATMQLAITSNERALTESLAGSSDLHGLVRELVNYLFGDARADLQRLAIDFRLHMEEEVQREFWGQYQRPWHLVQSAIENLNQLDQHQAASISRFVYGAASGLSQLYRYESDSNGIDDALLDELTETLMNGVNANRELSRLP